MAQQRHFRYAGRMAANHPTRHPLEQYEGLLWGMSTRRPAVAGWLNSADSSRWRGPDRTAGVDPLPTFIAPRRMVGSTI